jgi:hypothetical protein
VSAPVHDVCTVIDSAELAIEEISDLRLEIHRLLITQPPALAGIDVKDMLNAHGAVLVESKNGSGVSSSGLLFAFNSEHSTGMVRFAIEDFGRTHGM